MSGYPVLVSPTQSRRLRPFRHADARCQPGPTDPCLDGLYINFDIFEFYGAREFSTTHQIERCIVMVLCMVCMGNCMTRCMVCCTGYDPMFPVALKPDGATKKEFAWFCDMEHNLHAQYDAQVLLGRDLADAFVRQFTSSAVPKSEHDQDSAMLFPWEPCEPGQHASSSHQCWDDFRPRSPLSSAAGGAAECRPVPAERACLMMDSYTGGPAIAPIAVVAGTVVAVAIAGACALRFHTWTKRRGFSPVGGGAA